MADLNLNNLGNISFLKCFLLIYCKKFNSSLETRRYIEPRWARGDWQAYEIYINCLSKNLPLEDLYACFIKEAKERGLAGCESLESLDEHFLEWSLEASNNPTFIYELEPTNYLGDKDIRVAFDKLIGFDVPVREACKVLCGKGYRTYWSSANKKDFSERTGNIIKGKNVAYILIDPKSLSDNLKDFLLLNGDCEFLGIAENYNDHGKYYGIWAEITSRNMLCADISKELCEKALALPSLVDKQTKTF